MANSLSQLIFPTTEFAAPSSSAPGDTVVTGVANTLARSDHKHAREAALIAATTVGSGTSFGTGSSVGTSINYAREDHNHGTPSLSTTTPTAESFGGGGAVGTGTTAARADHAHAQQATPVTTLAVTNNASVSASTGAVTITNSLTPTYTSMAVSGMTGATSASRHVGATASGAPVSGTFLTGDHIIAQNGHVWICTAGGTPGTWADAGTTSGVTSVAGRSGVVTLTAADVGAGTFPGANTFTNIQTFNAQIDASGYALIASGTTGTVTNSHMRLGTRGSIAAFGSSAGTSLLDNIYYDGTSWHAITTDGGARLRVGYANGMVLQSASSVAAGAVATMTPIFSVDISGNTVVGGTLTQGTSTTITGVRATTTNASDTVDLGVFSSTGGAMELRIHAHLISGSVSITKIYELAVGATMGTVSTWYLALPVDASANAAATNDFALEVNRTGSGTFSLRFRQKSIAAVGVITFKVETLGDTAVTFASSTSITAAPAAVSTAHPSNAFVAAAGNIGIGTETPAVLLDVAGAANFAGVVTLGTNTAAALAVFNGAATQSRGYLIQTAGGYRWAATVTTGAESGSNAGANLGFFGYADDGTTLLGRFLTITRATGITSLAALSTGGPLSIVYNGATEDNNSYGIVGVTAPATVNTAYYSMTAAGTAVFGMGIGADNKMRIGAVTSTKVMNTNVISIDASGNTVLPIGAYFATATVTDVAGTGTFLSLDGSSALLYARKVGSPTFIVRGVASQSASLQEWQNSTPSVVAKVDQNGVLWSGGSSLSPTDIVAANGNVYAKSSTASTGSAVLANGNTTNAGAIWFYGAGATQHRHGYIGNGAGNPASDDIGSINYVSGTHAFTGAVTTVGLTTMQHGSGTLPLAIKARTTANGGQSGNMLEMTDPGGTTWVSFGPNGDYTNFLMSTMGNVTVGIGLGTAGAALFQHVAAATAGTTTQPSNTAIFRTSYWNGSANIDEDITVGAVRGASSGTTAGNHYLRFSKAMSLQDITVVPTIATTEVVLYSSSGRPKAKDGAGNVWNLDSCMIFRSGSTTAGAATIDQHSVTLPPGTYYFEDSGTYTTSGSTTPMTLTVNFSGTSTAADYSISMATGTVSTSIKNFYGGSTTSLGTAIGPAAATASGPGTVSPVPYRLSGTIVVTVSGTFTVSNSASSTTQIGCVLQVTRIA